MEPDNSIVVNSTKDMTIAREDKHGNMFKRSLQDILTQPMTKDMMDYFDNKGLSNLSGDMADAINASMVVQALAGSVQAYTVIRDTMGFKPVDQVQSDVVVRIDMNPRARELGE